MVGLVDLALDEAAQAAALIARRGLPGAGARTPMSADATQVRGHGRAAARRWGRVDILVNNAGICPMTPAEEITAGGVGPCVGDQPQGRFFVQPGGYPLACAPALRQDHQHRVQRRPDGRDCGGCALLCLEGRHPGPTKSLARILAPDIQVNAVAPGTTESEMTRGWSPKPRSRTSSRRSRPAGWGARRYGRGVLFLASERPASSPARRSASTAAC